MIFLAPVVLMLGTALTLILLRYVVPNFKYPWMVAAGGSSLALIGVFLWQTVLPHAFYLPPWQPLTVFQFSPGWLADRISWPYALSLCALSVAVIWTSVVRSENDSASWAGTILLTALGILAVSSENPLTLVLVWSAIDLTELITMLRSTRGEQENLGAVVAFTIRVSGTGLVLWANLVSTAGGNTMDFRTIPDNAGIYLLIAAGLRLGVLPLHLPYQKENVLRRGFGTTLRLISAAASLVLLARIPPTSLKTLLLPYLLILAAVAALYGGWMWVRASDEILGRPFWILGMGSLAVASSLQGNPLGSISWGLMLILAGGLIFLFSSRQRSMLWLPLLGIWGLSALPFSTTAVTWQITSSSTWLYAVPLIIAQALLISGFFRHMLHPGETSFESQEKWTKILYPAGLLLLAGISILLGLWGWDGVNILNNWWIPFATILLAAIFTILVLTVFPRAVPSANPDRWVNLLRLQRIYNLIKYIYDLARKFAIFITSLLEGEGGVLWSLLLLALLLSFISFRGR